MHSNHASSRPHFPAGREQLHAGDIFRYLHHTQLLHLRVLVNLQEIEEDFRGPSTLGNRGLILAARVEGDGCLGVNQRHLEDKLLGSWPEPIVINGGSVYGQVRDSKDLSEENKTVLIA